MRPCCSAHPQQSPWPFLVTGPDIPAVLMSFTTQHNASESFQLIRFLLLSQAHIPSQVRHADPQDGSVLTVYWLAVQVDLCPYPILRSTPTHTPYTHPAATSAPARSHRSQLGANTVPQAKRHFSQRCRQLLKGLILSPLRAHRHTSVRPRRSTFRLARDSLYGSSTGSCTLVFVHDG
jgi:hypothetical protein